MHTWFQLGGPAEYFAEPSNTDQLIALVRRCFEEDVSLRILGRGSNVLVRDEGVPGLVLRLIEPAFSEIRTGDQTITAGAGARLGRVVTTAVHAGLAGLESLVAVPGTLGGAVWKRQRTWRRHRPMDRPSNGHHPYRGNRPALPRRPCLFVPPRQPGRAGDP